MRTSAILFFTMVLAAGLPGVAAAQGQQGKPQEPQAPQIQPQQNQPGKVGVSEADQQFMVTAAQDGMFEVELGKVAAKMATSDKVKKFAEKMVNDHTEGNLELLAIAKMKGLQLPQQMDQQHQSLYDQLPKSSPNDFDQAYMDAMVQDHERAVTQFQKEKLSASDPDLKAWIDRTLPILEDHLIGARNLDSEIKSGQVK